MNLIDICINSYEVIHLCRKEWSNSFIWINKKSYMYTNLNEKIDLFEFIWIKLMLWIDMK